MIIIKDENDNAYDLRSIGVTALNMYISSLTPKIESEELDGVDGFIEVDTLYENRKIKIDFMLEAENITDYHIKESKVFRLFMPKKTFYLFDSRLPYKQWKAKVVNEFEIERNTVRHGSFEIEFISSFPFAESIQTTNNIKNEHIQLVNGVWDGFNSIPTYNHNENTFMIWNDSDIPIDPRNMKLIIIFKGVSNNLKITNLTTGDVFQYNGSTTKGDVIELTGIRHLKNGASIFKNTNHKLITLAPGWNEFNIENANDFQVEFDCRFYYV